MNTSTMKQAIGVLKLVELHFDHPTVICQRTVRDACAEAHQRLEADFPSPADLGRLYAELVRVTPRGHLPYVSFRPGDRAPYSAKVVNAAGQQVTEQHAKSIEGLVQIIALRFPPQEASQ